MDLATTTIRRTNGRINLSYPASTYHCNLYLMARESWDEYFINLAYYVASRATCPRKQVGAVLVNENKRIISTGYNGSKPGEPHCIDDGVGCVVIDDACKRAIHAENNCIKPVFWKNRAGTTLYCTDSPCLYCSYLIAKSGIIEVVFVRQYGKDKQGVLNVFDYNGVVLRKYEPLWSRFERDVMNTVHAEEKRAIQDESTRTS